jgi:hypothetical protein
MDPNPTTPLVLLGAGASAPAGVPLATEMTNKMAERLSGVHRDALSVLVGGLQMMAGRDEAPLVAIDVEQVMSAARLLGDRSNAALAPFVGAWHPLIEALDRERLGLRTASAIRAASPNAPTFGTSPDFFQFGNVFGSPFNNSQGNSVEREIKDTREKIGRIVEAWARHSLLQPDGAVFRELSVILTSLLVEFAYISEPAKVEYLTPLVEGARNAPLTVATLNYDNSVELSAANRTVACNTMINDWRLSGELPNPVGALELLKLHGSIDWLWDQQFDPAGPLSRRSLYTITLNEEAVAEWRNEP